VAPKKAEQATPSAASPAKAAEKLVQIETRSAPAAAVNQSPVNNESPSEN
jgi:hypothetical protein